MQEFIRLHWYYSKLLAYERSSLFRNPSRSVGPLLSRTTELAIQSDFCSLASSGCCRALEVSRPQGWVAKHPNLRVAEIQKMFMVCICAGGKSP